MKKYAVVYHDISEGENFNFELIDIGTDLESACSAMFKHFDSNHQQSKKCLMTGDDMMNHQGITYYVVNLEEPPVVASDYQWLSRYYILIKKIIPR